MKSVVDQDICYECGNCLRVEVCPVDAIHESPQVYDYPRALRKYFSDPCATHAVTGIEGRGTEESKTNDVTNRCGPGQVGIAIEVGRPTLGMGLADIQRITRALARKGITEIEPHNPIHSMIANPATGDLKQEMMNERVLSAIIELQVKRDRLRDVLQTVKSVAAEVESVFTLDVFTMLEPGLTIPREVLDIIESEGFTVLHGGPMLRLIWGLGVPGNRNIK
jgi:hypothetical protein